MQRWKSMLWICAGILTLAALAGGVAPSAIAQVRAALIRDLDSPVRGTRHIEVFTPNFPDNQIIAIEAFTPTIPAGKKLFLQSVSAHMVLTNLQSPEEVLVRIKPGPIELVYVDMDFQAAISGGQRHFTGNQAINTLVNPGEQIEILQARTGSLGFASSNFTRFVFIGYLVDANP